jgi:hypothetical protein
MTQAVAQLIKDAVAQFDDLDAVSFRNDYSGRGMYGRRCVGIVGDETTCMRIVAEVIKAAHVAVDNDLLEFDDVVDLMLHSSRDSMGRSDIILYWTEIEPLEDRLPDDDGQPDEAQEWHDFDPDC